MKPKLNNNAICVLGMHRSGTSAITRALNILGVYLGSPERMIEPLDDNPKGFWEHEGILNIHDNILSTFSSSWSSIIPLPDGWLEDVSIFEQKKNLVSDLLKDFQNIQLWGWKDPRTCLMLPLWNEISKELDINIKYLIIIRNPIDVANSLSKRNNFPENKSYLLWQLYLLSSLEHSKDNKRCIISYDEFLKNWRECLQGVSHELEIPWPDDEDNLNTKMEEFLDKDLRHNYSSTEDLAYKSSNGEIPESILNLYELCKRAERDTNYIRSEEFIGIINNMYHEHITKIRMVKSVISEEPADRFLTEYKEELKKRDRLIEDKDHLIHDITNTVSWKITKPLRWLGKLLGL